MSQGSLITQSARTRVHTHTRTHIHTYKQVAVLDGVHDVEGLMHSAASTKGPETLHVEALIESIKAVIGQIISSIPGGRAN